MSAVIFGLAAALSWGVYDFLFALSLACRGPDPHGSCRHFLRPRGAQRLGPHRRQRDHDRLAKALAPIAGIFFALATLALFAAFELGPITLVAPIVGAYPALAMLFAVAQGARPSAWQWLAIACVLAGAVITSRSGGRYEDSGELAKGETKIVLGLAILAGIGFAIGITAGQTAVPIFGDVETVWLARIFGLLTIGLIYLWRAPGAKLPPRWLPLLGLMGCLDVVALAALTAAGDLPSPELTTVVSSAFGAITSYWRACF